MLYKMGFLKVLFSNFSSIAFRKICFTLCVFVCGFLFSSCFLVTQNSFTGDVAYTGSQPHVGALNNAGCFRCHGTWAEFNSDQEWKDELGGEIKPGNAEASSFYKRIIGDASVEVMPPSGELMGESDVEIIKTWIDAME